RAGCFGGAGGETAIPGCGTYADDRADGGCTVAPGTDFAGGSGCKPMNGFSSRRERSRPASNAERGSALLIVLVFAAIIAISLYAELPWVVFESQRIYEQVLIDYGSDYALGIKLFFRDI